MNIQQALKQASQLLEASDTDRDTSYTRDDARIDASALLTHILQCNSAHLAAWPEKELDDRQSDDFLGLVRRRCEGIPVAHLTGSREFWSLDLEIDNSTLIPRAETETLVEYVLEKFADRRRLDMLDMGTGTGAIAIAVATEKPGWDITACEISSTTVELAKRNSEKHGAENICFIQSDWFERLGSGRFDIIISNPPYIADDDPHLRRGDVRFEPRSALTSGDTGMEDIEHLCRHARRYLNDEGWLVIEHGYDQEQSVSDCFIENGYTGIETRKDLSGHTRMTAGKIKL